MTNKYEKVYLDLRKNKTHSPPCFCASCMYPRYLKRSKHIKGRKFDKPAFYIWWMKFELKESYLMKRGKAEKVKYFGMTYINANEKDYENAPYLNEMKRILKNLPDCDNFFYPNVKTYLTYIMQYLNRIKKKESFLKIIRELETEIYWEWKKSQPEYTQEHLNFEDFNFAQRVSDYIQKKGNVDQRDLLRHFSAKRKEHLSKIWDLLKINHAIDIQKKGRTLSYVPKMKTKGRYWRVGI